MQRLTDRCFWPALIGTVAVGLALLAHTPHAKGQSCATPTVTYRNNVVVKKEVVVVKEVATILVPTVATFIQIPYYTAVYVPSYAPPALAVPAPAAPAVGSASPGGDLREVLTLMRSLDTRLKRLEGPPPPNPNPAVETKVPGPLDAAAGLRAMSTKCAKCHTDKTAADAGGGFIMFTGDALTALNDKQIRRILTRTGRGTMPPPKSGIVLSDEEAGAIVAMFDKP